MPLASYACMTANLTARIIVVFHRSHPGRPVSVHRKQQILTLLLNLVTTTIFSQVQQTHENKSTWNIYHINNSHTKISRFTVVYTFPFTVHYSCIYAGIYKHSTACRIITIESARMAGLVQLVCILVWSGGLLVWSVNQIRPMPKTQPFMTTAVLPCMQAQVDPRHLYGKR